MRCRCLSLLFVCALPGLAQVRYHAGDDPRWAAPDFDDSSWPVSADGAVAWPDTPDQMIWVRRPIAAPADITGPLEILWPDDCGNAARPAELFVNGVRVAVVGRMPPRPDISLGPQTCAYPLPAAQRKTLTIAVRAWAGFWGPNTQVKVAEVGVGRRDLIEDRARRELLAHRIAPTLETVFGIVEIVAGIVLVLLGRAIRGKTVIHWLGLFLVLWGTVSASQLFAVAGWTHMFYRLWMPVLLALSAATWVSFFEFLWTAYGFTSGLLLRAAQIVSILPICVEFMDTFILRLPPGWDNVYRPLVAAFYVLVICVSGYKLRTPGESRIAAAGVLI